MKNKLLILFIYFLFSNILFSKNDFIYIEDNTGSKNITFYNDTALIEETRKFHIPKKGCFDIVYKNIPNNIIKDSVISDFSRNIDIKSQNFMQEKMNFKNISKKFIGKKVKFNNPFFEKGTDYLTYEPIEIEKEITKLNKELLKYSSDYIKKQEIELKLERLKNGMNINPQSKISEGTLLYSNSDYAFIEKNNMVFRVNKDNVIFNNVDDLITEPSLMWEICTKSSGRNKVSISYLIENIDIDYIYNYEIEDKNGRLEAILNVNNKSNYSFENMNVYAINEIPLEGKKLRNLRKNITIDKNTEKQINFLSENIDFYTINNFYINDFFMSQKHKSINNEYMIMMNKTNFDIQKGKIRIFKKDGSHKILLSESNIENTLIGDISNEMFLQKNNNIFFDIKEKKYIKTDKGHSFIYNFDFINNTDDTEKNDYFLTLNTNFDNNKTIISKYDEKNIEIIKEGKNVIKIIFKSIKHKFNTDIAFEIKK